MWGTYLENFMSRPDVISTFLSTPLQNRGRNFVRSKRCPHHMSRAPPLIVCVLTIWKQLPRNGFERSGRGQESSRGHKFSILENFLSIRDFTSSTHVSFRSALVGACLPQTLLMFTEAQGLTPKFQPAQRHQISEQLSPSRQGQSKRFGGKTGLCTFGI